MSDKFSKRKRSEIMAKVKSKDSKIEVSLRKALWGIGYRYRKNSSKMFGKPDLVLPKYKTAIFIDSCFWHACKKHGSMPQTQTKFWEQKLEKNKKRDQVVNQWYRNSDWTIIRIWEHDIKQNLNKTVARVHSRLQKR